ncbi:hypothetical protein VTI28DRAFT_1254 [Corynascus sepedonium]
MRHFIYLPLFLVTLLVQQGKSQAHRNSSTMLVPIYKPFLSNLKEDPSDFNPILGGQNHDMCCRLVINESLVIEDDVLKIRPGQTVFRGTIEGLERFPRFPCGATYNGTLDGPGQDFWIGYPWCNRRCGGWAHTKASNVNKWLKPLISFILPSLVFSLIVPRRRHLKLPSQMFSRQSLNEFHLLSFLAKVPLASVMVMLDAMVWLGVVFSIAGPMMASCIYETLLDERAHILLVILVGNLDGSAWEPAARLLSQLPKDSIRRRFREIKCAPQSPSNPQSPQQLNGASNAMLLTIPTTPSAIAASNTQSADGSEVTIPEAGHHRYESDHLHISVIKAKLQSLLDSQHGFGGFVGGPAVFYSAAFIWAVITANQLAVGMFWMTIPHVALVACLPLASNNPSIWRSIFADHEITTGNQLAPSLTPANAKPSSSTRASNTEEDGTDANGLTPTANLDPSTNNKPIGFLSYLKLPALGRLRRIHAPASHSGPGARYNAAWVWNRGSNKAMWIAKLVDEYEYLHPIRREVLEGRFGSYLWISGMYPFLLIFVPVFFGTLVSYNTPQRRHTGGEVRTFGENIEGMTWANLLWYFWFFIATSLGMFTSVGGTVFILIGLYNNCICLIQAKYWLDRNRTPDALALFGSATWQQLYYANTWWLPTGIVSAVFMVVVAYIGWWFQRSLRLQFRDLASKIDHVDELNLKEGERM